MSGTPTIFTSVIAGIFLLLSAYLAWKLKNATDRRTSDTALKNARHTELRTLYESIFSLFERAIEQQQRGAFTLFDEFSRTNAAIHLLGSEDMIKRYTEASSLLEKWSQLQAKASPKKMQFGEATITILQSPDPAKAFVEPAREAYKELQEKLKNMVALMRWELRHESA